MPQEAGHIKNIYHTYSCCDSPAHSLLTFDKFRGSLGTSIFVKSGSATNNALSRLPSRLSFRFL